MEDNPITDFTSESYRRPGEGRVKLNVGGKIFSTTASTIRSRCPDSLLAALADGAGRNPVFIDRDPEIFSVLLSLLRSNSLPSAAFQLFSLRELVDEAQYYGVESVLQSAISPPPFNGIDASIATTICPAADGFASDFTTKDSSLWIAHGGQISTYDWNLSHTGTIRTHVDDITRICSVWDETAAIGSVSAAGLHFYDLSGGRLIGTTHWTDPSDPRIYKARAAAIVDTPSTIFASFDCPHRENAVLQIDKSTLQISNVICRQPGSSTKYTVPEKLRWLPDKGLLIGSAVTCGAFGYSGYIRIWDPRSGDVVWETSEPGSGRSSRYGDSFAGVDVDIEDSVLFKVCSKSGDVGMADLRKLGEDPWIYLSDENPSMWNDKGGNYNILHCYRKQVFVGRDGELEVWSRVKRKEDVGLMDEGLYRRNFVDKLKDSKRGMIMKIEGGSDRLFVSRENVEGVEVWESSNSSAAIAVV